MSYYGRGANNVYHLGAFIAALCYGAGVLGWRVGAALTAATARLAMHCRTYPDDTPPTALNGEAPEAMIGWHGSSAQYSAQTAMLMARAVGWLSQFAAHPIPVPPLAGLASSAYSHWTVRGPCAALALTCGGERIALSGGLHETTPHSWTVELHDGTRLDFTGTAVAAPAVRTITATSHGSGT